MLWAMLLALSTLDAVACLSVSFVQHTVIHRSVIPLLLATELVQGVIDIEIFGDANPHRASVSTVVTSRARYGYRALNYLSRLFHTYLLLMVKGLEVLHETGVILHLFHSTHSTQHSKHVGQRCHITDGP